MLHMTAGEVVEMSNFSLELLFLSLSVLIYIQIRNQQRIKIIQFEKLNNTNDIFKINIPFI